MLYTILCNNYEDVVGAWTTEEDDAVTARLLKVHEKIAKAGKLGVSEVSISPLRFPKGLWRSTLRVWCASPCKVSSPHHPCLPIANHNGH
jgi:hypothetical protein